MKSLPIGCWINGILRLLVGGAFVFAGVLKIADPAKFALDVSNYRLVPHEMINLVAILIPWIEITAGSFVLAGIWLRAAALVITSLTVMFFAVIVSALARGLNIECGCFGTMGGNSGAGSIVHPCFLLGKSNRAHEFSSGREVVADRSKIRNGVNTP